MAAEDVQINLNHVSGVDDYAAHVFGSVEAADRHLARARGIMKAGRSAFSQVQMDPELGTLSATCRSSESTSYQITCALKRTGTADDTWDWAEVSCSCPAGQKQPVCKHALALLLYRVQGLQGGGPAAMTVEAAAAAAPPAPESILSENQGASGPSALPGKRKIPGSFLRMAK
jgi:hypothetical protein